MDYFEYQKAVYDQLRKKYQQAPDFTFSVRQIATKDAERNYFIGKEKSKYFAFTCWDIPIEANTGTDLTDFKFERKDDKLFFYFQFYITRSVKSDQDKINLFFGHALLKNFKDAGIAIDDKSTKSNLIFFVWPQAKEYSNINDLFNDWEHVYQSIAPTIDATISEVKQQYPDWKAGRYTKEKFDGLISRMHERIQKYRNAAPGELEKLPEEVDVTNGTSQGKMHQPLNKILYGPPGTGKTYRMLQLIKEMQLEEEPPATQTDYQSFVSGYHWWELLAMVLLQLQKASVPQLLEHELVKAKLAISNIQHPSQRLWGTLQHHTVEACPHVKMQNRHGELIFYKDEQSNWRLNNQSEFKVQYPYLLEDLENFQKGNVPTSVKKHFTFTTCHQSLGYEDFIEGIKPVMAAKDNDETGEELQYEIRKGIFYQACEKAAQQAGFQNLKDALSKTREERKEAFDKAVANNQIYVLFLDEINRCNVSAVFGELITLIEDDKRLGAENEIPDVLLPYSQTLFGVPANLHLIGTMNTADRSVEALDTALRRRFSFDEMIPRPELLYRTEPVDEGDYKKRIMEDFTKDYDEDRIIDEVNIRKLLSFINYRLSVLSGRDHQIGHAYFLGITDFDKLKEAFAKKVIPLLQEYFFNDYAKIGLVLGRQFVHQEKVNTKLFASFEDVHETAGDYEAKTTYTLADPFQLSPEHFKSIYAS